MMRSRFLGAGLGWAYAPPRVVAVCVVLFAALFVLLGSALTAVPALALSEGRVYEQVTPHYKQGYGGVIEAVAPNGESVAFTSSGAFAGLPLSNTGNAYVARRVEGVGWQTRALQPPFYGTNAAEFSSDLGLTLTELLVGMGAGEYEYRLHDVGAPDTVEEWKSLNGAIIHGAPSRVGASGDLCHVMLEGSSPMLPESPSGGVSELYDLSGESANCGSEVAPLRLVGVKNELVGGGAHQVIDPCGTNLGGAGVAGGEVSTTFNAVSGDGGEVFFNTDVSGDCTNGVGQVFVRLGGLKTIEVSRPLDVGESFGGCGDGGHSGEVPGEVPCPGAAVRPSAFFAGASEDGSIVFFTSTADLVAGGVSGKNDLYMARIGCPEGGSSCEVDDREVTSLVRVSEDPTPGQAAEVDRVFDVAPDGGAVYFIAHGVLTSVANREGEVAVNGAENLYAYNTQSGVLEFVAALCSGSALSGTVEDSHCPRSLGKDRNDMGTDETQVTEDGEFLVFSSYGQLIRRGPDVDTDAARDIYRFDMASDELARVSLGEDGFDANGNGEFNASIDLGGYEYGIESGSDVVTEHEMSLRAVSEDGSRIVFTSAEPLSLGAINGLENVYEWHIEPGESEGRVSLISSGSSVTNDFEPVITPSGRDVFFMTTAGLVPSDTENDLDVYDARLGGGFPPVVAEREQCSSDACQGPLTDPAPLLVPGSVSQAPGGNFSPPASVETATLKNKIPAKCLKAKKLSHGKCVESKARKSKRVKKSSRERRTGS